MLRALAARSFALIDRVEVAFGPGLNVLTGETGTGKSLLLDALALALGGRAHADQVRAGQAAAVVDALFALDGDGPAAAAAAEFGVAPEADGTLLLQREIGRDGRGVARLGGRLCTAGQLRAVGELLVDVHGQGDQQRLLRTASQTALLDAYAGAEAAAAVAEVRALRQRLQELAGEARRLAGDPGERERRRDMLAYACQEIEALAARPDEDEELGARRALLANAERLARASAGAYEELHGHLTDDLGRVTGELEHLAAVDARLGEMAAPLREALIQIGEVARDLRRYHEGLAFQPGELERLEERLQALERLKRKYGGSLGQVAAFREQAAAELADWEESDAALRRLDAARAEVRTALDAALARLERARRAAGRRLQDALGPEFAAVGLPDARLLVTVSAGQEQGGVPQPGGVEFLWSANPGEPERPLQRAASGGELSRAMLALKAVLAARDDPPVLVFDEVDAGVGGTAAQAVAERLTALARERQVFCVTHLAVIAARADHHFSVRKVRQGGRTTIAVQELDAGGRRDELARMLSGRADATARAHAESLLREGRPGA